LRKIEPEEEPPYAESLSWKLPSEESYSDSTIVVVNASTKSEKTSHVHKAVVLVGIKKSTMLEKFHSH